MLSDLVFSIFLHLAKDTVSLKILPPSSKGKFPSSSWGSPGALMLTWPWSPLAPHGLGYEWRCHSELSGACNFFRHQSCEAKGGGSVISEQTGVLFRGMKAGVGVGGGGPEALLSLRSLAHCEFPSGIRDPGVAHRSYKWCRCPR